ncbi:merR regulatory family protein [[Clostridium] bifermentans ATCC 638]|uniref:MerR regulatory family protein n=1 Tax=Paraclostridium bifermentans ATCC 638 = DSM 14991 TaxID=1233171 RepID=T4VML3_PARBF|nr:MerR family transcriptional regulator [Paraclostridium bifermentans]EQK41912.1 merR regulatory family protein [[Clostridium] bifermentans ATCC 638] [Paraclostridium bifermentans ATCC 638 = DSM 14991]RIZ59232.1 MerR family transcriptional regulator [Paraclostridium bifermentans]UAG18789.1 MerR family transcriptional regulator [Paraclostridium bifermentans]
MKNLYSIGEVSKIKKITVKSLRYYHKVGILIPKYIDDNTGYRYYSIDQFIYIDIIKGCRALGTSIAELQEIFKDCETEKLLKYLHVKRAQAEENIIKMKEIITNIDNLNSSVESSKELIKDGEIRIKHFNKRYIVVEPCKEVGSLKELIPYSELEKTIKNKNLNVSIERGIGYDFDSNGKVEPFYVFSEIINEENIKIDKHIDLLPEGDYLTLAYTKENEEDCINKIVKYIKENKLEVKKFIEIELFNDFFNTKTYSCQIQILI